MKWKKLLGLATFLGCAVAMAGGASYYIYKMELLGFSRAPGKPLAGDVVEVVIPPGTSGRDIARLLLEKGVINDDVLYFNWLRMVTGQQNDLKAGTYELSSSMSPEQITKELVRGRQPEVRFTIPEGLRVEEIAAIIADVGLADRDALLGILRDPALAQTFGVPVHGAGGQDSVPGGIEGYLFPDTYQFPKGTSPLVIVRKMRARLDEKVDDGLKARMKKLGWDLHTTLTVASLIEKETGVPAERAHISSVFHNRLKKKMKLQTDPTVLYGLDAGKRDIKRSDLQREHPYNTYVIDGLPPGPIASPGRAAIVAALSPTSTPDLFFVAKGQGGEHTFCPDYECHTAAVDAWQASSGD